VPNQFKVNQNVLDVGQAYLCSWQTFEDSSKETAGLCLHNNRADCMCFWFQYLNLVLHEHCGSKTCRFITTNTEAYPCKNDPEIVPSTSYHHLFPPRNLSQWYFPVTLSYRWKFSKSPPPTNPVCIPYIPIIAMCLAHHRLILFIIESYLTQTGSEWNC
jgi:hypothetical protein